MTRAIYNTLERARQKRLLVPLEDNARAPVLCGMTVYGTTFPYSVIARSWWAFDVVARVALSCAYQKLTYAAPTFN